MSYTDLLQIQMVHDQDAPTSLHPTSESGQATEGVVPEIE